MRMKGVGRSPLSALLPQDRISQSTESCLAPLQWGRKERARSVDLARDRAAHIRAYDGLANRSHAGDTV